MKKYLVTSALPYANGPLHFGHLAGAYLPADVYVRHKRLNGEKAMFISGSDEHGVAITLNAQKEGKSFKEYVDEWHKDHSELFKGYGVEFDYFGQTSAQYHAEEAIRWFKALYEKKMIEPKDEQQLQCQSCKNYLPDRYVEGTCYECGYEKARGDECPNCGTWIDATKLKNPECQICESHDIKEKTVTQYYLMLSKYQKEFEEWFGTKTDWRKTVVPYVTSLLKEGLIDRAITRDLDWGIDVPIAEAKGKKMYVWFDAPIGYVSNTDQYLKEIKSDDNYLKDWWNNSDTEIINFIGKDNIIFHCLIFPIMSMASGIAKPVTNVPANQYLNLEGKQFSKSQGWYVDSKQALEEFGQDALRYYLISIIPETNDSSFSWEQFAHKINGELANNIGNFINRALKFSSKNWPEGLDAKYFIGFKDLPQAKEFQKSLAELRELLDNVQIRRGIEKFMSIGQDVNTFFSDRAPWAEFKQDPEKAAVTMAYSCAFAMSIGVIIEPFLPALSNKILTFYGNLVTEERKVRIYQGDLDVFSEIFKNGFKIKGQPEALVPKIDPKIITKKLEELESLGK